MRKFRTARAPRSPNADYRLGTLSSPTSPTPPQTRYHMYGADMGALRLLRNDGSIAWNRTGDAGNGWRRATAVPVQSAAFSFVGIRGGGYRGDMAVDDVYVGCGGGAGSTVLRVAPGTASDADDGTELQPFRTLEAARDAMRRGAGAGGHRIVRLQAADYYQSSPLALDDRDSGTVDATITYMSDPADGGRQARVSGGRAVPTSAFSATAVPSGVQGVLAASLFALGVEPAALGALANPWPRAKLELFYGGRPMTLARDPNIAANGTWLWAGYENMSVLSDLSFRLNDPATGARWRAAHETEGGELCTAAGLESLGVRTRRADHFQCADRDSRILALQGYTATGNTTGVRHTFAW